MEAILSANINKKNFYNDSEIFISLLILNNPSKFIYDSNWELLSLKDLNNWFLILFSQINAIINCSDRDSIYYSEALFIKTILQRIYRSIEFWMNDFDHIFDNIEDKEKFIRLLRAYLFNGFKVMLDFIIYNCPSTKYISNREYYIHMFSEMATNEEFDPILMTSNVSFSTRQSLSELLNS